MKKFLYKKSVLISILVFIFAILKNLSFDGTIIIGLNSDLGKMPYKTVVHKFDIINLGFSTITLYHQPTCGCAELFSRKISVSPMQHIVVEIPYKVYKEQKGKQIKDIIIYVKRGELVRKLTGVLKFYL